MYRFSDRSNERLSTCDRRLVLIAREVIKHVDCTVLEGHRKARRQQEMFREGRSKLQFPNSKHNSMPSRAMDLAPYPIDWDNFRRWTLFAGFVKGVAAAQGVKLRCGADWDGDFDPTDQRFHDMPHFELLGD